MGNAMASPSRTRARARRPNKGNAPNPEEWLDVFTGKMNPNPEEWLDVFTGHIDHIKLFKKDQGLIRPYMAL
jgi:putative sterol carrier protein